MKRNVFLCLCLCLCLLFCACGTLSDGSSAPAEEGSEVPPVPEDPNAKAARAYLEELLDAEKETGTVDWLTSERAEAIRDCVKALKTPILTEEDVLRIAECAVAVVSAESTQSLSLPPCGVLASVLWSPTVFPELCEAFYTALVSYTLYLFTPPDYLFRENEVIWPSASSGNRFLYFPLAGAYTSRREALDALRQEKNGVQLPLYGFGEDEYPLDCARCGTAVLFRGSGETLTLDLLEVADRGGVTPPEGFFIARADLYVRDWMDKVLDGTEAGLYDNYDLPDGSNAGMYRLLTAEDAREIREKVELLPAPIVTRGYVSYMVASLLESSELKTPLLLLPGVDGKEDILLPPGVETLEEAVRQDKTILAAKAYEVAVYLIDLFTPSAFRSADLLGSEGTYYALDDGGAPTYLFVAKGNGLYLVDEALTVSPLFITWVPWEG